MQEKEQEKRNAVEEIICYFVNNEEARRVLLMIWDGFQAWDDAADGDENSNFAKAFRIAFVDLPASPLYGPAALHFQIQQCYIKWEAANAIERHKLKDHLPKAYVLRAEFYQLIVNMVLYFEGLDIAIQKAPEIWACYGENYNEYREEILCQTQDSQHLEGE